MKYTKGFVSQLLALLLAMFFFGADSGYAQSAQEAPARLSPSTRMLLRQLGDGPISPQTIPQANVYRQIQGRTYLPGLVRVTRDPGQSWDPLGVIVGTRAGNIWTVHIPIDRIREFVALSGMDYIELDMPLRPNLQEARSATRVDSAHQGKGLIWPMLGTGIVSGVIDFGFDYAHPSFFDTSGQQYRVKAVWELGTQGTPPPGYAYGHELRGQASILAQGTDNPEQTHGTGVAGIMAGSGMGSFHGYSRGFAPESEMVFVGVRRDSIEGQWQESGFSDFIDGISYIMDYAEDEGKPVVINISWGSQSGPHDGTSLFNQACDQLSGPGKIIVMSAGNDGQEAIHLSKEFSGADSLLSTYVVFSSDTVKRTWIDIWGEPGDQWCVQVSLYHQGQVRDSTGFVCLDDQIYEGILLSEDGNDTLKLTWINSLSTFNQKPRMLLDLENQTPDSAKITIKSTSAKVHAWNESYYYGYKYGYSSQFAPGADTLALAGNNESTVSDMGSAKSVVLVGAYASKISFRDLTNKSWSYQTYVLKGDLVPFSSRGPFVDGRISPDITAPGLTLATASSSFDVRYLPGGLNQQQLVGQTQWMGKDYYYSEFTGTSASAPAASGIIALMLEANPRLTPTQVKAILAQTAIKDGFTGQLPASGNNDWGKGKINAWDAVLSAAQANGVIKPEKRSPRVMAYPNPHHGQFQLLEQSPDYGRRQVIVRDLVGRTLQTLDWVLQPGQNVLPMQIHAAPGVYLITIQGDEGSTQIRSLLR